MAREERGRLARRWKARATACLAAPEASLPLDSLRREPRRRHLTSPCQNPAAAACLRRLRTPATAACLRRAGNPRPPPVSPHKGAGRPAAAAPPAIDSRYCAVIAHARDLLPPHRSAGWVGDGREWRWRRCSTERLRETRRPNREDEWEAVGVKCWSKRLFD
uniref:Uncharacterized protein n=1 Tax=Oryza rufipogon TaxID=4529 RepID=A0A0E0P7L0_ORYRU